MLPAASSASTRFICFESKLYPRRPEAVLLSDTNDARRYRSLTSNQIDIRLPTVDIETVPYLALVLALALVLVLVMVLVLAFGLLDGVRCTRPRLPIRR